MKKTSMAVLVSLSAIAGMASAQEAGNGIVMSQDSARAAQIEDHARTVQMQPAAMQVDEAPDTTHTIGAKKHHHHHHGANTVNPMKAHAHKVHVGQ